MEPDDASFGETYQETVTLTHHFNEDWKVRGRFVKHDRDESVRVTGPLSLNENTGILNRFFFAGPNNDDTTFYNVDLTGHFDTWGVKHTLLLGGDYYDNEHNDDGVFSMKGFTSTSGLFPASIDINNPQYGLTPIDLSREQNNTFLRSDDQWFGFYLQDQFQVMDKLHILAGVRYDNAKSSVSLKEDETNAKKSRVEEFSQRYGLLYQPVSWLSVYGSYVEAFNASNSGRGVASDGSALAPERSHQYEAGLKGEWFDGNLSSTVTFYDLTKKNIATSVVGRPGIFELTGEAESKGVEVDITGQVTDNLNLVATYSYTDNEITAGNNQGNRLPNVPLHAGSLWTHYQFEQFGLPGLKAGAGVFLAGQREGDLSNSFQLPGYGRVDASLGYSWNLGPTRVTTQLNIENLLDKEYFTSALGTSRGRIAFGAPRTFLGMVRVEF
jgi:iron complex outermembrane receptor protein